MLVTSRGTGRWVLPKGWPKKRLGRPQTAALEAFEEAGLTGEISPERIGRYRYRKILASDGVDCRVDVYLLRVVSLLDEWPEREQRERRWFTQAEAAEMVEEPDLKTLLLTLDLT